MYSFSRLALDVARDPPCPRTRALGAGRPRARGRAGGGGGGAGRGVAGTGARITHTRKTTPGLRALERYAVTVGGGVQNRASLADAVLWKDNHWALLGTGDLGAALTSAPSSASVVVEVENVEQLERALAAGVRHILVDNQPAERLAAWLRRAGRGVTVQASGGITPERARAFAEAGAQLIAIGALTHSAPAAPIRCDIAAD